MTQEDKELLLKDLCARLPYGVKIKTPIGIGDLGTIKLTIFGHEIGVNVKATERDYFPFGCKPYLRPMSSMTKEEVNAFTSFDIYEDGILSFPIALDWLNIHHFDYRGLIEKGLAIEAPEGMYKKKE